MSKYTCLNDQMRPRDVQSLCLGVPEHHGQRLANSGNVPSLKEEEEEMTSSITFQVREISKTLAVEILVHQFVKMDALLMDFKKSSSS